MGKLRVEEGLSRPFEIETRLLCEREELSLDSLLGSNVAISLELGDKQRWFHGMVSRFCQEEPDSEGLHYSATLVPWTWFLDQNADYRAFQDCSVPEIVKEVFGEWDISSYRSDLTRNYPPRSYCVQYAESDFGFLARLLAEEGIGFYFEHERNEHRLVLFDSPATAPAFAENPRIRYAAARGPEAKPAELSGLSVQRVVRPGRYATTDYNFESPSDDMRSKATAAETPGGAERIEVFEYPGCFGRQEEGERYSRMRIQSEEMESVLIEAQADEPRFVPGSTFDLVDHYRDDFNRRYLLLKVCHSVNQQDRDWIYDGSVSFVPSDLSFRPRRIPKPRAHGVQTAVIVGRRGEEIHVDKYGRVKLQFHWDRRGKRDEHSSCWVRVGQTWAGKGWGAVQLPRVGEEVIVDFEAADPDRPLVIGRLYNAERMPPYELPSHATRATLKSRSSKGGTSKHYNELRFEDAKDREQILLHAERDLDERVGHDARLTVDHDQHLIVRNDRRELCEGSQHGRVQGDWRQRVGGSVSFRVDADRAETVGGVYALEANREIYLNGGMNVVIEAGMQLTLKCGANFITLGPSGVAINGSPLLMLNSGGAAGAGSPPSPQDPEDPEEVDDDHLA